MAINFGTALGTASKTFADHLMEMRKTREASNLQFANAEKMAGITFGYNKRLKELDVNKAIEVARIKHGGAGKGGITLNPMPKIEGLAEGFSFVSKAQDATARQTEQWVELSRALQPLAKLKTDEAIAVLKSTGNLDAVSFAAGQWLTQFNKGLSENQAPPEASRIFGKTLSPLMVALTTDQAENVDPRMANSVWRDSLGSTQNIGGTPARQHGKLALNLAFNGSENFEEFTKLTNDYMTNQINSSQLITQVRQLVKLPDANDNEILSIVGTALSFGQPKTVRDSLGRGEPVSYLETDDGPNIKKAHGNAKNLSDSSYNLAKLVLTEEPIVTDLASGVVGTFGKFLTGGKEIMAQLGFSGVSTAEAAETGLHKEVASKIQGELANSQISEAQRTSIMETIRSSEKTIAKLDLSNEKSLATYQYHMQKLSLAFAYSKFIQGGAGGNAVSNADFQNTMNALFATYDMTPEAARRTLATGMITLHRGIEEFVLQKQTELEYSTTRQGKRIAIAHPIVQKFNKERLDALDRYANAKDPYQYFGYVASTRGEQFLPVDRAGPLTQKPNKFESEAEEVGKKIVDPAAVPDPKG
tara:strand:+ start:2355 stop:4115 length:1761 start_codon:yes stop_codon:yes gene_type:complete